MFRTGKIIALCLLVVLPLGCATNSPPASTMINSETIFEGLPGVWVPGNIQSSDTTLQGMPQTGSYSYDAIGPFPVGMSTLEVQASQPDRTGLIRKPDVGRIENQISDDMADQLREEALLLPPSLGINNMQSLDPELLSPVPGTSFESLDANDCCAGGLTTPPDPELAVGPNHIIAVVNTAFAIYDKSGNILIGPSTFASFFSGVANCSGMFDPNVIYDEEQDRFILGVDGDGSAYCVAATTGPDPTNTWNRYSFATDVNGNFFDYPHAGVGLDAIYLGANMFSGGFAEGRLWAMDKFAMYSGGTMSVVTRSTGSEGTPQPMNLHGFAQGTWPVSGPHYGLTDGPFNGAVYGVWSWEDPFGTDVFTNRGTVDLNSFTGITAAYPINAPQLGSTIELQANDWRVQDAEYRNGLIWMANTLSCNPGGGTVDCVRWAAIDPTGTPVIIDAGIYASDGEYRFFADVATNHCDDMLIGYTKSSSSMYPGVWVTGREGDDLPGTLRAEVELKAGERDYDSFQSGTAHRWGDYTGMTVDPDGETFWYLGEYSKDITNFNTTTWATFIGSFTLSSCASTPSEPGQATNPNPSDLAVDIATDTVLGWSAGSGATSHDVYFGTNPTPDGAEFQGNQAETSFTPGPLDYATSYYWRIDEVNDTGTTTGNVWSFTTRSEPPPLPGQATNPSPSDGAVDISVDQVLGWSAGGDATSHDVYFGTNPAPDGAEFQGNQAETSFTPGALDYTTSYYWRIDEVNETGTTIGNVWSFTTEGEPDVPVVHIASLQGTSVVSFRTWNAIVTVEVEDSAGAPVADVLVDGNWSKGTSGSGSCTTDPGGVCQIHSPFMSIRTPSADFSVTDLSGTDLIYDPGANEDGNGGVITVYQIETELFPDAVDDNYDTTVDVPVNDNVLDNDDQGDAPATVTAYDAASVQGGTVSMAANGAFTYSPPAGFDGSDSFGYTITDNNGDSDSATVTITISPDPNLLPDAVDDNYDTTVDVPVSDNVLDNDDQGDAPATVTAYDAASVQGGTVSMAANGAFTYTPPAGFDGSDSFGYTITDNNGDSDSATVTITISPDPNLLPDAVDDNYDTTVDVPVSDNVLDNDDQGDAPATVTAYDAASVQGGTVSMAANGAFTYTPPAGFDGSDSFGYTITDNNGDSDSATVTITISPDPNLLPDAVDDNYNTTVDVPVSDNVLDNDDQGDAPATVTAYDAASVQGGTVSMAANGAFTYTPPAGFDGSDSFGYTITDNNGDSDSATVTITVNPDVGGLTLTVSTYSRFNNRIVVLAWSPVESPSVEIYRDNNLIITVANKGSYWDIFTVTGSEDSYEYRVCEVQPAGACGTAIANF